ncbi:hypothetical protein PHLGIDRAFT_121899 [Phlebiopsis gigantea 11061_1 CR5-6]|uniref:Uncharacterized protein n=1 Tax=Phlebiopsis gigantea (strain 11061_1 CR5-6) TaxID=745531 RepID=A0A0C3S1D6_PHLG1|nr:hypothetical protein PHLGIDRAFT_121899 [Phlebiopsis gigantea 11061_1 CR5-6]
MATTDIALSALLQAFDSLSVTDAPNCSGSPEARASFEISALEYQTITGSVDEIWRAICRGAPYEGESRQQRLNRPPGLDSCTREPHSSLRCNCRSDPGPSDAAWGRRPTVLGEDVLQRTTQTQRDARAGAVRVLTLALAPCPSCPCTLTQVVHIVHADPTDADCTMYFRAEVARVQDPVYFAGHNLCAGRRLREVFAQNITAKLNYFVDVLSNCS